ncbi:MAG: hypothetical protein KW793_04965, partial [Candidatus Doudnabacteria bacterium]|nr:hypothetical protein [Candidatus Doudnabacteria bacterium]
MSIRLPLQTVLDQNDAGNTGATSVRSYTFNIPQDTDAITVKVPVASINGTSPTADVYLQTSDDGGTTFYDVLHLPTITGTTIANANALWGTALVCGPGFRSTQSGLSSLIQTSVLTITGNASVRGLGAGQISGLPILGIQNRIQISYGGTVAANTALQVQVKVHSQSAT